MVNLKKTTETKSTSVKKYTLEIKGNVLFEVSLEGVDFEIVGLRHIILEDIEVAKALQSLLIDEGLKTHYDCHTITIIECGKIFTQTDDNKGLLVMTKVPTFKKVFENHEW